MAGERRVLLTGGSVRTMDPARPAASALVVEGDRVLAVLDDPGDAPAGAERVDLGGGCVLPGFTDAHVHFPSWAAARREVRLDAARSAAEAVAVVAGAAGSAAPGGWLRGRGWRDASWPDAPSRAALDAVTGEVPAALRAHDGHSLWLNSAALAIAGPDLEVPGGVVERDAAGEPTGILREESAWRVLSAHVEPPFDEVLGAVRAALPAAAAAGIVSVHDKDGARGAPEAFGRLAGAGELTLRVWQSLPLDALDALEAAGRRPDAPGAGMLRVGYLKGFMDGTLGSRTARLLDGTGVEITSAEALAGAVRRAAALGWPVAVHAIGDRANRDALDAFEATAAAWRPQGLRHRVEHAQCVHPDDVGRFAALGITASVQYTHATSDRDIAERLWADRIGWAYPFRSLLDAGVRLAGGSDAPVEELDPLAGLRAAVLRTGDDRPAWRPEQALPVQAALRSFTAEPAWLAGEEALRGRLAPGLAADLVVLDRDPLADLAGARVTATMVGGRWVHGPWS